MDNKNNYPTLFKVFKKISKYLCLFLAVLMFITSIQWNSFVTLAQDTSNIVTIDEEHNKENNNYNYQSTTSNPMDLLEVPVVDEVIEERDEYSKTFRKLDGTYEIALYKERVNYLEDGVWKEIDNRLVEENEEYSNISNILKVKLPKKIHENKKIKLTIDNYDIEITMLGINKVEGNVLNNNNNKSSNIKAVNNLSSVYYKNINDYTDLKLSIIGSTLKEEIILNKYQKDISFTFIINSKGLVPKETPNGILFYNEKEEVVFVIDNYFMYDANNSFSYDIETKITELKKYEYQLTVIPNDKWLREAVYPVVVDPIVEIPGVSSIQDTYISEIEPNTNYSKSSKLLIGSSLGRYRSYIKFSLPEILNSKSIIYSTLELTVDDDESNYPQLNIHRNNIDFKDNTATWNNMYGNNNTYDKNIIDSYIVYGVHTSYIFDITKVVHEWVIGKYPNYGLLIKTEGDRGYASIYSNESSYKPYIKIGYIDRSGLNDYWTYTSQDLGNAGVGYVNDFTGNLLITRNDYIGTSDFMPLDLTFIYNKDKHNENIGYGNGWRTIYDIHVSYIEELKSYKVVSGDGVARYYQKSVCSNNGNTSECYIAEDGSGNILLKLADDSLVIKSKDDITYYFYSYNNKLKTIEDKVGNKTTITYYSDRIDTITDQVGNKLSFSYSSNRLDVVYVSLIISYDNTNPEYKIIKSIDFEYSQNGNLTKVEYSSDYNGDNLFLSKEVASYTYDNQNKSLLITDLITKDVVKYTFTVDNRVETINSYHVNDDNNILNYGKLTFDYEVKKTTVTDHIGKSIRYLFDNYGHTINILDDYGSALFYQYVDIYKDENPNYNNNHKLLVKSLPQKSYLNPIKNHSFELSGNWNYENCNYGNCGIEYYENSNRAYIVGNGGFSDIAIYQTIELNKGIYTLSGLIKSSGDVLNGGAYIDVEGASIKGTINSIYGSSEWKKYSLTFIVNEDNTVIKVKLKNDCVAKAYFDNIQISEGFLDSRYNLLENPSFENGTNGWIVNGGTLEANITNGIYEKILGNNVIKIEGSLTEEKTIKQTININNSNINIQIGGWAKANTIPQREDRLFEIRVRVYYGNNENEIYHLPFNANTSDWQYIMYNLDFSDGTVGRLELEIVYKGTGTAYFDDIQVYIDDYGSSYGYDANGNLIRINTSKKEGNIEIVYDEEHPNQIDYYIDENGNIVDYEYTPEGLIKTFTQNNVRTSYLYNEKGQVEEVTVGDVNTNYFKTSVDYSWNYKYITKETDEFGNYIEYEYNELTELLTKIKDPIDPNDEETKYIETIFEYDDFGRLISVKKDNSENIYTYENDKLISIKVNNFEYIFEYNNIGQINRIYLKKGSNTQDLMLYEYLTQNINGINYYTDIVSKQTYGNGYFISFEYNEDNQLIAVKYSNENKARYEYIYDEEGNLAVYIDNRNDIKYYYKYDSSGRLREVIDNSGNHIQYNYDNRNENFVELIYKINGEIRKTEYKYDANTNRYIGLEYDNIKKNYVYNDLSTDALQRLKQIELITGNKTITQTFVYDDSKVTNGTATTRIKEIVYVLNPNLEYFYKYKYDKGNIKEIQVDEKAVVTVRKRVCLIADDDGNLICTWQYETETRYRTLEKHNYEYDNLNQLKREDIKSTQSYTMIYEYDDYGNIKKKKKYEYLFEVDIDESIVPLEEISYDYNDDIWLDQLTNFNGHEITYDNSGNPIEIILDDNKSIQLSWEGRELSQYTEYRNGSIYQTISYNYNDLGYRTCKEVDYNNGIIEKYYYYLDGSKILYEEIEYYENNVLIKTDKIYYTYDIDGTLVSMNLNGVEYFYIRNLQGDITDIVDINGEVKVSYRYDAWGNIIYQTDNDLARINPYRYRGYRYDE
ncbi:MAG TPA: DNRLRE domain-containing protein, partial [Haloplasmataceae bacterium]